MSYCCLPILVWWDGTDVGKPCRAWASSEDPTEGRGHCEPKKNGTIIRLYIVCLLIEMVCCCCSCKPCTGQTANRKFTASATRREDMISHCSDNLHILITFQELWMQVTRIAQWTRSQWAHSVFWQAKSIWQFKIGYNGSLCRISLLLATSRCVTGGYFNSQICSVLSETLHAHCTYRYFVRRAVCLACICTSWSWNVS